MQKGDVKQLLRGHFRCPENIADFTTSGDLPTSSGFFRFGPDAICFGQCSSGIPLADVTGPLHVACGHFRADGPTVELPFDPVQVVNNLRLERYVTSSAHGNKKLILNGTIRNMYYSVRPLMPVGVRKRFQKIYFRGWEKIPFPTWPVDRTVETIFERLLVLAMKSQNLDRLPFIWFWPDGAESCTIMTHDVETSAGMRFCSRLMDLNDSFGIKSSFQIVPEQRYAVSASLLENISKRGFEINVHDLNHDGHLFSDRGLFLRRAEQIKRYAKQFGAIGFRSAIMYRNADWFDALDFSYDMSMPNVAHLDPQQGGCCTVLPFFIGNLVELPVTTTQDYSLFNILHDYSIRLWKQQIALIHQSHGLVSFIIHPDYLATSAARQVYVELLEYLAALRTAGKTCIALPGDVADWWRLRREMNLVKKGDSWQIDGKGSERATIAYATLVNDKIVYKFGERHN